MQIWPKKWFYGFSGETDEKWADKTRLENNSKIDAFIFTEFYFRASKRQTPPTLCTFTRFSLLWMNGADGSDKCLIQGGLGMRINPVHDVSITANHFEPVRKCWICWRLDKDVTTLSMTQTTYQWLSRQWRNRLIRNKRVNWANFRVLVCANTPKIDRQTGQSFAIGFLGSLHDAVFS